MADDNPVPVTGAIHAGSCACDDDERVSVKHGLTAAFDRVAAMEARDREAGQGMYL